MRSVRRPNAEKFDRSSARVRPPDSDVLGSLTRRLVGRLPLPITRIKEDGSELAFGFAGTADNATSAETLDGTPAEDILPDGLAPASSPAPTVQGGIGALFVKWSGITNHDPVTYEVHLSAASGFTPDSSSLAGETAGTMAVLRKLPDGTALAAATTYYVKIVAKDVDGSAAPSAQGSAQLVLVDTADLEDAAITATKIEDDAVTTPKIAANAVTANELAANSVTAGKILAGEITADKFAAVLVLASQIATALSGTRLTLDNTDGFVVYNSADEILASFPADGSDPFLRGTLQALGLQLDAGDADWNGAETTLDFVGASDVLRAQLFGGGDASSTVAGFLAEHDTQSSVILRAREASTPTDKVELSVNRTPGAAAGSREQVVAFGNAMGAWLLVNDLFQSDFIRSGAEPFARIHANSNKTVANNTITVIDTLGSGDYDSRGMTSAANKLTVVANEAGLYAVKGSIVWNSGSAVGLRGVLIRYNGATFIAENDCQSPPAGNFCTVDTGCDIAMNAGDYLELIGYQTSGGNLAAIADYRTGLSARRVGSL